MMLTTRKKMLLLCVTALVEVTTATRTAKMPDLAIEEVAHEYRKFTDGHADATVTPYSVSASGFRLPDSVNHLKVKTNSSNPYKNEKNVTLNLNIPASVSGFLLEEIDLKYVKKSRKKSKSNKMSNLLIKYFTNRSSNLHLSSVTKEEDTKPEYYQYEDVKERRDTPENREGADEQQSFERPFRYQHKYPLRLLEKIKSSTNRLRKMREGKHIDGRQGHQGETDARLRRSSAEVEDDVDLTEDDLMALESILTSKTIVKSQVPHERTSFADEGDALEKDPSMSELMKVFERTVETTESPLVEHEKKESLPVDSEVENLVEAEDPKMAEPHEEEKKRYEEKDSTNWFSKTIPGYFLSVLQPFRPGTFGGHNILARRRRDADRDSKAEIEGREPYKKFKYSYVKNPRLKNKKTVVAPLFPTKTFGNRRHLGNKMIGTIELIHDDAQDPTSKPHEKRISHSLKGDFTDLRTPISLQDSLLPHSFQSFSHSLTDAPLEEGLQRMDVKRKLSKLDYYFSTLKVDNEVCRQRLLCEVASRPVEFSPLAEMFTQETRLAQGTGAVGARVTAGEAAGEDVLGGEAGARLLAYHEAMERGARRSPHGCDAYASRCRTSPYDIIDTASLKLWREISNWLTVRVLAGRGSLF